MEQVSCLTVQDIAVDSHASPSMVKVHLKQSKTDPFRHGVDILLGCADAALCPVASILAYCAICSPALRPFFIFRDGTPPTRDRHVTAVWDALSHVGVNTGHSFRIGAATSAAHAGLSKATIKMLSCWKSAAYERYVRTPREGLAAITRTNPGLCELSRVNYFRDDFVVVVYVFPISRKMFSSEYDEVNHLNLKPLTNNKQGNTITISINK